MPVYKIDVAHSEIGFAVRHMMFAKVRGRFTKWSSTLAFDADNPAASKLHVEIDAASIDTHEPQRDGHLRSADFFDAERFPEITFASKRIVPVSAGRYELMGDLTMRGATQEVKLDVERTGSGKDPWGSTRLGFTARGSLSRSKWGLVWNQALEAGAVLVSDKVEIDVEVQVVVAAVGSTATA